MGNITAPRFLVPTAPCKLIVIKKGLTQLVLNYRIDPRARTGIVSNERVSCRNCDFRIGFGTGGQHDDSNTCGNEATCRWGPHIKATGYIFVQ